MLHKCPRVENHQIFSLTQIPKKKKKIVLEAKSVMEVDSRYNSKNHGFYILNLWDFLFIFWRRLTQYRRKSPRTFLNPFSSSFRGFTLFLLISFAYLCVAKSLANLIFLTCVLRIIHMLSTD